MPGSTEYILFDFDDMRLADRANVLRAMNALALEDRFRFLKKAIVCDDMPGEKYVPNEPELLDRAWTNAVRAAPRYGGAYWMEFEGASGVPMAFGFDPRRLKRLNLTIGRQVLAGETGDAVAAELFEVVVTLANALQPVYGYGLFNYDTHEAQPAGAGPQAAWDINVFGAALVGTSGRDALHTLPAWKAVDLEGGGLALAMAANAVSGWKAADAAYRGLATLLGVSAVRQGG
ncbi:MAG TPA: hypothetical protein VER79_09750 [Candidatus Limnocylindrales bacterium]|nr:hypothetical protein [Candidatus Limnocylindrales bacterium]